MFNLEYIAASLGVDISMGGLSVAEEQLTTSQSGGTVTLTNNPSQDTASQSFYTKDKKASLVVENKFQFTDLIVVINQKIVG